VREHAAAWEGGRVRELPDADVEAGERGDFQMPR
jgi:hypothetical protein